MLWYDDTDLSITFDDVPHVLMRYITPMSSSSEKVSIEKYPFINKKTLDVTLEDKKKNKSYCFQIPKNYCWDGASIPRFCWRIIGGKTDNTFLIASLIHDWMCEHHDCVENNRNFSSKVFKALLKVGGVSDFKANVMYLAVDNFQRFCGWGW